MKYLQNTFTFNNKEYKATWIPGESPDGLEPITQVYGFCFNDEGQLLVQRHHDNPWQVMGGSPERGETFEQTLIREVEEEVDVEISDIVYLGSQLIVEGENKYYQIRCAARITKLNPQTIDPDKGIIRERKFIDPKEYGKISNWGEIGQAIANQAAKVFQIASNKNI